MAEASKGHKDQLAQAESKVEQLARLNMRTWCDSYLAAADELAGNGLLSPKIREFWRTTAITLREVVAKLNETLWTDTDGQQTSETSSPAERA